MSISKYVSKIVPDKSWLKAYDSLFAGVMLLILKTKIE